MCEVDWKPILSHWFEQVVDLGAAEVPWEEASRYGVCNTTKCGEITDVVEKPDDPPSTLVMTGFSTFTPAIFHACRLVQPATAASTRSASRSTC